MGLLDSFLGGEDPLAALNKFASENSQVVEAATSLLSSKDGSVGGSGGLQEILGALQSGGLGDVVSSWLSNGPNQEIGADKISELVSSDMLSQFASKAGVGTSEASGVLANMLPELVNQLSPDGAAPNAASLGGLLDGLKSSLGSR
jgi:uncharacterized protein YidB (DUF937 family)